MQRQLGTTTVYVTHDQVEAMTMGDRVAVLKDGVLQQVGTPRALYDHRSTRLSPPSSGSRMNLIEAAVADGVVKSPDLAIPVPRSAVASIPCWIGIRPESWDVASAATPDR